MDLSFLNVVGGVRGAVGICAAVVALWVISRLMRPKVFPRQLQAKTCGKCGWKGDVSTFKPKCPSCANAL